MDCDRSRNMVIPRLDGKTCSQCGIWKGYESFHKGKNRDGYRSDCAACSNKRKAAYLARRRAVKLSQPKKLLPFWCDPRVTVAQRMQSMGIDPTKHGLPRVIG